MSVIINASSSQGLQLISDLSGNLSLQANGTTVATASSSGLAISTYNPSASLITSGTSQASTSGTSIDFTSIPSWVKRITVMFNGVSTNGTSIPQVQLGTSGGVTTSGYSSSGVTFNSSSAATGSVITTGFATECYNPYFTAAGIRNGQMVLALVGSNIWTSTSIIGGSISGSSSSSFQGGVVTLAATLTTVRITTVNGTDTFDAGSINILYE